MYKYNPKVLHYLISFECNQKCSKCSHWKFKYYEELLDIQMLEYTRSKCYESKINLFTNFSFNNKTVLNSLVGYDVQLFLSIDSPVKHELEEIRRGCKYEWIVGYILSLPRLKHRPFIVFTIMEDNLHRIYDIGKFAFDNLGIICNTVRRDAGIEEFVGEVILNFEKIRTKFEAVKSPLN